MFNEIMDAQTAINKLVENLSFQVLTGPCNKIVTNDLSKNATGTPVNVKIKLRHKDDKTNKDIFSMHKIGNTNNANNLRLVNSDQTITSFNLLMDSELHKKTTKKSQKKFLHLFKPGVCLRNQNEDDDYTYMPEPNKNKPSNASEIEDKDGTEKFGLTKKYILEGEHFDDPIRRPKMFLGKCKPGGCLDPPFDEDNYSYEPVKMNQSVNEEKYSTQKPRVVVQNPIPNNTESDKIYLRSSSPRKDSFLENDIKTDSLITYPNIPCDEPGLRKDSMETSSKSKRQTIPSITNEYLQAFYVPPKSKETSISSKSVDTVENENGVFHQNQNKMLKSISKDSIMPATGGPVAPVLPDTITLSVIESNNADQKINSKNDEISFNEINEAPIIFAPPLIELKRSDNMVKGDSNKLSYLRIVNLPSEEKFEQLHTSTAPSEEDNQDKDLKPSNETSWKETNKDLLVKNKDIIVIAPIKKSSDTNASKSGINSTLNKNNNSKLLVDDEDIEILKLNKLKEEPVAKMEISKSNSQIDNFYPPVNISFEKTSSIKIYKPPEKDDVELLKINKFTAPDDLSFTSNNEDLTVAKTPNDVINETNVKQLLYKECSTILRTSPQVLFDPQRESNEEAPLNIENMSLINNKLYPMQKMSNQDYLHNESVTSQCNNTENKNEPDVFDRLTNKTSISSFNNNSQIEVYQKIPSSSNIDLSQSLKSKSENGSIHSIQDSTPVIAKTSTYNIHNFRGDINIITKDNQDVNKNGPYNNQSNQASNMDATDLQNSASNLNSSSLKKYPEGAKMYNVPADQTLITTELNQINESNLTTGSVQKLSDDIVHKRDDKHFTAINEISRNTTDKDVTRQKILLKGKLLDVKNREEIPKIVDKRKEDMPFLKAQRKYGILGKEPDTNIMPKQSPNKYKFENNLIHLDFALHLVEDSNKKTVLKTFDSECLPSSITKAPLVFKSTIKVNEDKIKIPVNANTNVVLEVNNNLKNKKYTNSFNGLSQKENIHTKEINVHTLSKINISYVMLQETITSIYEHNLVPIETMIRELKEDVETLIQNQKIVKQMLKANKNKPKHVTSNRRCGCYRK